MSLSHSVRARARRSAVLALMATGVAATSLGATASPASAVAGGNFEINDYRHFAGDTQEAGSDEFYLLKIGFQVQLGVRGTFKVTKNTPYEIDDIDDEEYHSVATKMGRTSFATTNWDPVQLVLNPFENQLDPNRTFNKGPWVFGSFTVMMESDTSPWSSINSAHSAVVSALQNNLRTEFEALTPFVMFNEAVQQGIIPLIDPNVAVFRNAVFQSYLTGKIVKIGVDAVAKAGIWSTVTSLADDIIGAPHFTVAVGVEDNSILGAAVTAGAKSKGYWSASGTSSTTGNQIMPLPITERRYKQQYKGDGARYVMDVRAGRI